MMEAEKMPVEEAPPPPEAPDDSLAPDSEEPQQEQMGIEEVVAKLREMPPEKALQALAQILAEDPEAMKLVERALQLAPEQQPEAVEIIISRLEGMA